MTFKQLEKMFKTSYQFNLETGLPHSSFLYWKKRGSIPIQAQLKIELLTKGALKARLRDDLPLQIRGKNNEN